jgi:hypothetical protein
MRKCSENCIGYYIALILHHSHDQKYIWKELCMNMWKNNASTEQITINWYTS